MPFFFIDVGRRERGWREKGGDPDLLWGYGVIRRLLGCGAVLRVRGTWIVVAGVVERERRSACISGSEAVEKDRTV